MNDLEFKPIQMPPDGHDGMSYAQRQMLETARITRTEELNASDSSEENAGTGVPPELQQPTVTSSPEEVRVAGNCKGSINEYPFQPSNAGLKKRHNGEVYEPKEAYKRRIKVGRSICANCEIQPICLEDAVSRSMNDRFIADKTPAQINRLVIKSKQ